MSIPFWSKLQVRMTISYVLVTLVIVLLLEIVVSGFVYLAITRSPLLGILASYRAAQAAQDYALKAAVQGEGNSLNPQSTFKPGQPGSLGISSQDMAVQIPILSAGAPYINPGASMQPFDMVAVLIAPGGRVLTSSYPDRYPASAPVGQDLWEDSALIQNALAGKPGSAIEDTPQGRVASVAQTIWSKDKQPLGAVYVRSPAGLNDQAFRADIIRGWLRSWTGWLILMLPFGAIFGFVTTRGMIKRVNRLVHATRQFAEGDYTQRVALSRPDEIGQLERQFNRMAEQLVESIARQKLLTEQSARQEERARIEQEMQSARYIQLTLLPKELPALPGWQLTPYYRPARQVGGDLYDFLQLPDGQLGILIGDVTDKGIPAALVMATTCTMLRAAAPQAISPGEVLSRVNELLHASIPPGMFVTCFYATLDPFNGRLRYANAGHDLPYYLHQNELYELRAAGMPLGLMPGEHYSEQEIDLAPGGCILFYTDGLVEAHNPGREMFGFPRLKEKILGQPHGTSLIEYLMAELQSFTGEGWEQEDDVTMITLMRS
ncbi:MAG: SpoIIE family protein phosphatase [Omnitrophica WOR_2 bacterium]